MTTIKDKNDKKQKMRMKLILSTIRKLSNTYFLQLFYIKVCNYCLIYYFKINQKHCSRVLSGAALFYYLHLSTSAQSTQTFCDECSFWNGNLFGTFGTSASHLFPFNNCNISKCGKDCQRWNCDGAWSWSKLWNKLHIVHNVTIRFVFLR